MNNSVKTSINNFDEPSIDLRLMVDPCWTGSSKILVTELWFWVL